MKIHKGFPCRNKQTGVSLLEVLVTLLILMFGLLGLAGLQGRATTAELESYQRGQAIILLQDMVDRINNNADNAASYVTNSPLGTGATDVSDCTTASTRTDIDKCEWSKALKGAAEQKTGSNRGAMINGRGCVATTSTAGEYLISVVWQGMSDTVAPATTCGQGSYDSAASRRAITSVVRVADLAAN